MPQLPHNLKALLQDIGEDSVLLRLSIILADMHGWSVYRSYAEDGCDIVLRRTHGKPKRGYRKELRVEVKSRQNLVTERDGQQMIFTLTKAEYERCHFLVAYWFERGDYFIVPHADLKPATKSKKSYRFFVNILQSEAYNDFSKKYLKRWDRITNQLR
jgi:hypothetical protein